MANPANYNKNPLSINPIWKRASAEPPQETLKRAAIMEMAVIAEDEIEDEKLRRDEPTLTDPTG